MSFRNTITNLTPYFTSNFNKNTNAPLPATQSRWGLSKTLENLTPDFTNFGENIGNTVKNLTPDFTNFGENIGDTVKNITSDFTSKANVEGTKSFLQFNGIIAKFAFLLLVLIIFILALRLGTTILSALFTPPENVSLVNGLKDGKHMVVIPQNPNVKGSKPILRSKNNREGLVFTWSVWIMIDDFTYKQNEYKHVFHKGNDDINLTNEPIGMNYPNNGPGLYITPNTNNLVVVMNTFDNINEEVIVKDIPLNKWVNVIIRVDEQKNLDVYINGRLARRHVLSSVPKQNYGDIYVNMNGGYSGYLSSLRYFADSLGIGEIQSIVDEGPNLRAAANSQLRDTDANYLSTKWFFQN